MAEARAKTVQQEREEVYARLQLCSQLSLSGGRMGRFRRTQGAVKRKMNFRGKEKTGNEASNGLVCCYQWVSMHEV